MSYDPNNEEQQLLVKQLIRSYMKEQTEQLNNENRENKNNSFVFLENNTLNMLLTYMFMQLDNRRDHDHREEVKSSDLEGISQSIDSMMEANRVFFEEIIDVLKERT
ncbi:hypothetical protein [Aquibacillus albus]|uniref:IDEAL domain-containing protein n=1 Tax=Aquibacillus albus TaxID=1168171 RepID=A0ABS2N6C8_9BACI|nr:hypothetical protein [Aquibacillus albus]MBM7573686.1 hypothetical protein [Aquibacillus albus]